MASVVRALQKLRKSSPLQSIPSTARFDFSRFAEGDRVYISGRRPRFSKPLQRGGQFDLPDGFIPHDQIIGARPGESFTTNTGKPHRLIFPDLDTYIASVPRKVTPVYSTYASYITALFDIHVSLSATAGEPNNALEILEAGTGHGSVTLALARAIQAANPPLPDVDIDSEISSKEDGFTPTPDNQSPVDGAQNSVWQNWLKSRRAIVHSVEVSSSYSRYAEKKVVAGFRRGLYLPHIDFHIAKVNDWVDAQMSSRKGEQFLSYVFLDLPSCHQPLLKIAKAMKDEALIAIFVPSITQIGECVQEIQAKALPLKMEKVLELGDGISNGRRWDVRLAYKKAKDPAEDCNSSGDDGDGGGEFSDVRQRQREDLNDTCRKPTSPPVSDTPRPTAEPTPTISRSEAPVMVCRPKVGDMIVGGGFVGLWRRIKSDKQ